MLRCDNCNIEFTKKPAQIRAHNFCCKKCSCEWSSKINNKQIIKRCIICGKTYKIPNNQKYRNNVCSKQCNKDWLKNIYFQTPQGREHLKNNGIKSAQKQRHKDTKPEKMVRDFLTKKSIEYIPQYLMYNKFIVDFYLPSYDIVIEVLGDYWHGNPEKYGDENGKKPLTEKQLKQKK